jgi:hypothetical protein
MHWIKSYSFTSAKNYRLLETQGQFYQCRDLQRLLIDRSLTNSVWISESQSQILRSRMSASLTYNWWIHNVSLHAKSQSSFCYSNINFSQQPVIFRLFLPAKDLVFVGSYVK